MKSLRLDKYLADMGIGTRSEIKEKIKKGLVYGKRGNRRAAGSQGERREKIQVTVNGAAVSYATFSYYMLNKPAGCVSATEDLRHETVLDLD